MSYLKSFFRNNWYGAAISIFYFTFSIIVFFLGLGYGAGCTEIGLGYCDPTIVNLYHAMYYLTFLPVLTWEFFYYWNGQALLVFSQLHGADDSLSSIESAIVLSFSLFLGATTWVFVGSFLEKLYKFVKGEDK
ncbi:MAG TPA: hypothetical protein VLD38_07120 [Nitrosopumilaceae archaeon]|nr:hypothetical protein [Nitrosopumilaceae archaeon]